MGQRIHRQGTQTPLQTRATLEWKRPKQYELDIDEYRLEKKNEWFAFALTLDTSLLESSYISLFGAWTVSPNHIWAYRMPNNETPTRKTKKLPKRFLQPISTLFFPTVGTTGTVVKMVRLKKLHVAWKNLQQSTGMRQVSVLLRSVSTSVIWQSRGSLRTNPISEFCCQLVVLRTYGLIQLLRQC